MSESVSARRVNVVLTAVFGALALILAMVGIWGVVSNSVSQRSREFGIRMAMGARQGHVLKMVLSEVIILTLVGIVAGLPVAWALTRFIRSLLFEVAPADPATFGAIAALLIFAGLVASYIPARRATRIDPAIILRSE
jgi:putative ABC transport system permease protein